MSKQVIGKLDDWDDVDVGGSKFYRIEEGDNVGRIFTKPYQFFIAWVSDRTGKNRSVRSAGQNCPLVKKGYKVQPKCYAGFYSRKLGKPAIIEVGTQIISGIKKLRNDSDWGDPRGYDINIYRGPKNSQPLYSVSPKPKTPLTDEEKEQIKEFLENTDLAQMTTPPTPEQVLEELGERSENKTVSNEFDNFESDSDDDDDIDFGDI